MTLPPALEITDKGVIDFLTDPGRVRYFWPFLAATRTVRETALELGVSASRVYYWLGKMRQLGLVCPVAGTSPAAYRSVADALLLRESGVVYTTEDLEQTFGPYWQMFLSGVARTMERQGPDWVAHLYRDPEGRVQQDSQPAWQYEAGSTAPVVVAQNAWLGLYLTPDEARALYRVLDDLGERFRRTQPGDGRRPYLMHLGLIEVER